jgi:MFS family permease
VEKVRLIPRLITADALATVFSIYTMFGPMTALLLNALGLTKGQIGAILAILPFSAIVALALGPWLSRAGPKRLCVVAFLARKLVLLPILFTPWLAARFGSEWVFPWVAGVILLFGVARAVAEASAYAWGQELVDNATRGKFTALDTSVATVVALLASLTGSLMVGLAPGLPGYLGLFGAGIVFGLLYVGVLSTYPGGRPTARADHTPGYLAGLILPFRDRNFTLFLGATALLNIFIGYGSFLPIYLVERLGMTSSQVFVFDIFQRIGILLCTFFWGWSADRFGSRPIMVFGLVVHGVGTVLFPCLPDHSRWTAPAAYGLAFILTGLWMAYASGTNRYLFARAVPPDKRNPYMTVYYAVSGCSAALGPLSAGWFLERFGDWDLRAGFFWLNAYTLLAMLGGVIMLGVSFLFRRLAADTHKGSGDFFSVFTRGSFFMALESSLRFHYAIAEDDRITTTERMGQARSAMNQEEVLEALSDPSFNVRYEAIVSITRLPPTERLLDALIGIVRRQEPELSMTAAWALGRIGDRRALPALREAMTSEYGLLRARIARTLGVLKDAESLPLLVRGFLGEKHDRLRVAYASALGALRDGRHLDDILSLLRRLDDETLRQELLLAVARILGGEHHFVRLWRDARANFQAAAADAMLALAKRFGIFLAGRADLRTEAAACARAWIEDDPAAGLAAFTRCLGLLESEPVAEPVRLVLRACRDVLAERGPDRLEFLLLGLHAMSVALVDLRAAGRRARPGS